MRRAALLENETAKDKRKGVQTTVKFQWPRYIGQGLRSTSTLVAFLQPGNFRDEV